MSNEIAIAKMENETKESKPKRAPRRGKRQKKKTQQKADSPATEQTETSVPKKEEIQSTATKESGDLLTKKSPEPLKEPSDSPTGKEQDKEATKEAGLAKESELAKPEMAPTKDKEAKVEDKQTAPSGEQKEAPPTVEGKEKKFTKEDLKAPMARLLEKLTIQELLGKKQGAPKELVILKPTDSVEMALNTLARHRILSAPVRDPESEEFDGFLDIMDILFFVLRILTGFKDENVQWASYVQRMSDIVEKDKIMQVTPIREIVGSFPYNKFCPVNQTANMFQLVEDVLSHHIHRAPVFDFSSPDRKRLVGIASQTDVIRYLAENAADLGLLALKTVSDLKLAHELDSVVTMSDKAMAVHAFYLMYYNKVSAVAIVNSEGTLVANISASDLRGLSNSSIATLFLPVCDYLIKAHDLPKYPMTCKYYTRLDMVLVRMGIFRVHRLWLVDDFERPIGLISLSDIMKRIATMQ
jgi:CBS domain-containing protein